MDCSVILTVCNEIPHIFYTIQSIINELDGYCKYEIIVVDNLSTDKHVFEKNKDTLEEVLKSRSKFIKYVKYDDKQSHWVAKTKGIEMATGRNIFFIDAHCLVGHGSLKKQIEFLDNFKGKIGGVHCYHNLLMSNNRKFEHDCRTIKFLYRFRRAQVGEEFKKPYEVAHMTTCGMMCQKKVLDELGGWNEEFGTRWGGEAYMNLKHGVCGYPHYIHPETNYYHLKHEHGYTFGVGGYRNVMNAVYSVGGEKWLKYYSDLLIKVKGKKYYRWKLDVAVDSIRSACKEDMEFIKSKQVMSLDEFYKKWGMT